MLDPALVAVCDELPPPPQPARAIPTATAPTAARRLACSRYHARSGGSRCGRFITWPAASTIAARLEEMLHAARDERPQQDGGRGIRCDEPRSRSCSDFRPAKPPTGDGGARTRRPYQSRRAGDAHPPRGSRAGAGVRAPAGSRSASGGAQRSDRCLFERQGRGTRAVPVFTGQLSRQPSESHTDRREHPADGSELVVAVQEHRGGRLAIAPVRASSHRGDDLCRSKVMALPVTCHRAEKLSPRLADVHTGAPEISFRVPGHLTSGVPDRPGRGIPTGRRHGFDGSTAACVELL